MSGMKGKLTVTVLEAKELKDTELLGKMDPYVVLEVMKEKHKTKVMKGAGTQATFNQAFIFNLEGKEDSLHVRVMDEDLIKDDQVGRVDIPLKTAAAATGPVWYQLVDFDNFKKITGQVHLKVEFVGTGGPAVAAAAAAAPAKSPVAAVSPMAGAPAAAVMQQPQQPQMVYAQQSPQMVYAQQPQMMMGSPMMGSPQQMVYAAPQQPQLVRGTDGKLYAIQQPMQMQPQVVYMQAPAQGMQQPPRYM